MLKIKDNIDLKDLLKFGFIFRVNLLYKPSQKDRDLINIKINQDTREIDCTGILGQGEKLDCLYDLIINDLVEKVEDNDK